MNKKMSQLLVAMLLPAVMAGGMMGCRRTEQTMQDSVEGARLSDNIGDAEKIEEEKDGWKRKEQKILDGSYVDGGSLEERGTVGSRVGEKDIAPGNSYESRIDESYADADNTDAAKGGTENRGAAAENVTESSDTGKNESGESGMPTDAGNPYPQTVPPEDHTHSYISETIQPTCVESGKRWEYCSVCGQVKSETVLPALGHLLEDSWFGDPPTCTRGGYLNRYCSRCGYLESSTSVPPLEHVPDQGTEMHHGNCRDETIVVYCCVMCSEEIGFERYYETDEHDWIWVDTDPVWSDEAGDFVTKHIECCSRCGTERATDKTCNRIAHGKAWEKLLK